MKASQYIDDLAARGRWHFTTTDANQQLGSSKVATRAALRRLKEKGEIATPHRGFHVIVPPEYRGLGCPPPDQFIPQLMAFLCEDYYVGLLSAAEYHGAAHHRPQLFQVVNRARRSSFDCGRVRVGFIARSNVHKIPTVPFNTLRAVIQVSSPEATALDLVGYARHCGGLDNVATVLSELAEVIDPFELARVAAQTSPIPWGQRLGFLLDMVGAGTQTGALAKWVADKANQVTPLTPQAPMRGAARDSRWQVAINATVEPDV